jgi:hypothetical protein
MRAWFAMALLAAALPCTFVVPAWADFATGLAAAAVARTERRLIAHNIGVGPRVEDGLFAFEITGHYRYRGGVGGETAGGGEVDGARSPDTRTLTSGGSSPPARIK